eukprot:3900005-Amphidinium_carterae.1
MFDPLDLHFQQNNSTPEITDPDSYERFGIQTLQRVAQRQSLNIFVIRLQQRRIDAGSLQLPGVRLLRFPLKDGDSIYPVEP